MNKGTIVVVTKGHSNNHPTPGHICTICRIDESAVPYLVNGHPNINNEGEWCEKVRGATYDEIQAYHQGIRDIKDMESAVINNYEIY